jgi:hypothetical protein
MEPETREPPGKPRTALDVEVLARDARRASELLHASLPNEVSVAALNVWSKAPFQLLCVREALIWRLEELARCACDNLEHWNLAAAALLTRAAVESVALTWKLRQLLEERDKHSAQQLNELLMRAFSGARNWSEMPKPYHALDLVRELDTLVRGYFATYESLSEIAHPNGQGVFGLFGSGTVWGHADCLRAERVTRFAVGVWRNLLTRT